MNRTDWDLRKERLERRAQFFCFCSVCLVGGAIHCRKLPDVPVLLFLLAILFAICCKHSLKRLTQETEEIKKIRAVEHRQMYPELYEDGPALREFFPRARDEDFDPVEFWYGPETAAQFRQADADQAEMDSKGQAKRKDPRQGVDG